MLDRVAGSGYVHPIVGQVERPMRQVADTLVGVHLVARVRQPGLVDRWSVDLSTTRDVP